MSKAPDFVVNTIKSYWKPGQKILDVGCGPAFLRNVFGPDYCGADVTNDTSKDVDIVCPAGQLLVESDYIDLVVMKSALYLFSDREKALKEAMRVLKKGGRILIFDYNRRTQKMLQRREEKGVYPCWTGWGLRRLIKNNGFTHVHSLIPTRIQPHGIKKIYHLLWQELFGTWAIVCGTKE